MNTLDIISVNIWQIIISLCNLTILFLMFKRFLFKPVKKMIADREALAQKKLDEARDEMQKASDERLKWESRMLQAEEEAGDIVKKATIKADKQSKIIIKTAKERADSIVDQARFEAELEYKNSASEMKHEIIDLSSMLAGKMLNREINEEDHKELINDFIDQIGQNR
ncbi:MAG: F0F1 ATP synthase subunit B [Clostridiales bacterium]|nr:F0F1 ATP synthase subunit B [Clostridiales bacterium]